MLSSQSVVPRLKRAVNDAKDTQGILESNWSVVQGEPNDK